MANDNSTVRTDARDPRGDESRAARSADSRAARLAHGVALAGLAVYCFFAPASIAAAWIGIGVAALGWIARSVVTRDTRLRRSPYDLPLWLFFAWTVLSCALSAEPRVSLAKIPSALTFLLVYLVAATLRARREAAALACVLVCGASVATLWGVAELVRGRGVVVERIADASPLRASPGLQAGDCVWRVNGARVSSVAEIDDAIRRAPTGSRIKLSIISHGEHVEREGATVTDDWKREPSPSGVAGTHATHRFRASGWTRHYETFAETVQIAAQLALGFALAHFVRRASRRRALIFAAAFALLACGVALTAMRTTIVALACGALVTVWRASAARRGESRAGRRARVVIVAAVVVVLAVGALAVRRTRDAGALALRDPSAQLRAEVARVYLSRVRLHPVFGHGMDAVHLHWSEWGFPGSDMLHAHSTPLQLAFDRGLPAALFWLWLIIVFWLTASRAERLFRDAPDDARVAAAHGLLLGACGALVGFFLSSLVNYNFGDSEVALLLWWLAGTVAKIDSAISAARGTE
ncbi:MAG: O-antigen ligase family protein [Acidobacteria bacterium]|nr:O-antigen ligase family protein [Acidobacteriota bacterium]